MSKAIKSEYIFCKTCEYFSVRKNPYPHIEKDIYCSLQDVGIGYDNINMKTICAEYIPADGITLGKEEVIILRRKIKEKYIEEILAPLNESKMHITTAYLAETKSDEIVIHWSWIGNIIRHFEGIREK